MTAWNASDYGPTFSVLIPDDRMPELGPGVPNASVHDQLHALTTSNAVAEGLICDAAMGDACLAGLWLLHDYLEESHAISQRIETPTGSYWHGLMHRREPDFGNSRYWFRRVGEHPIFEKLGEQARELAAGDATAQWTPPRGWDPYRFIDACEAAIGTHGAGEVFCRRVQRLEWNLLFDYSFRAATGKP